MRHPRRRPRLREVNEEYAEVFGQLPDSPSLEIPNEPFTLLLLYIFKSPSTLTFGFPYFSLFSVNENSPLLFQRAKSALGCSALLAFLQSDDDLIYTLDANEIAAEGNFCTATKDFCKF